MEGTTLSQQFKHQKKISLSWKIHSEFGSLLAATLLISKECDRPGVPTATAASIRSVTQCLETHLPKISKNAHTNYLQLRAKSGQTHRGLGVNPPAGTIPTPYTSSCDPPHPSAPSPHLPQGDILIQRVLLLYRKRRKQI